MTKRSRHLAVERLHARKLFTTWLVEVTAEETYVAISQLNSNTSVCLAYSDGPNAGMDKSTSAGVDRSERILFDRSPGFGPPITVHDIVFTNSEQLLSVGNTQTENSLPEGDGEPTVWRNSSPAPAGLPETLAGNSGAFHAANAAGRGVGEDDLKPIVYESGVTSVLPLPGESSIGAALDLNGEWIVGYADADAVVWESSESTFEPRILQREQTDSFGVANSISQYGIVGGSYRRANDAGGTVVGMLWSRDGSVLREFQLGGDTAVTHVIDYLAVLSGPNGSSVYQPITEEVMDLGRFLAENGMTGVPMGPLDVIDVELSSDGERVLILFEHDDPIDDRQYVASLAIMERQGTRQHPWNRFDVNDDGTATPLDALSIINHLAAHEVADATNQLASRGRFYDVNGDEKVTPIDALWVINQIARKQSIS